MKGDGLLTPLYDHLVKLIIAQGYLRAAMFYSFFGTCKKNNVNPYEWLKKVLEIIPEYPANKIGDLLPQNLKI
ncbi:MAG: transposase domain-containing protein [Bacteroidetes bacterium]|nr:transposase domain-containing protein [Bacteroidota bacterium]MCL6101040.1 transposase domain-containing protein [Bacteroidota bacterium]